MASSNNTLGQYLSEISELLGAESSTPPEEVQDKLNWYLDNIQTALIEGSGIGGFDVQVVDELPETGEQGILYLVSNSSSGTNIYDEYIWIESQTKYEMLGTTEVDISGKQDTLVSGENIKTINNSSVLGEGNLEVVSANPELEGTESNLTSLKIDNTKYKVSSVMANPTLAGTEDSLTSLEVDGTKYILSGGGPSSLYCHHIQFSISEISGIFMTDIYSTASSAYTNTSLYSYIESFKTSVFFTNIEGKPNTYSTPAKTFNNCRGWMSTATKLNVSGISIGLNSDSEIVSSTILSGLYNISTTSWRDTVTQVM